MEHRWQSKGALSIDYLLAAKVCELIVGDGGYSDFRAANWDVGLLQSRGEQKRVSMSHIFLLLYSLYSVQFLTTFLPCVHAFWHVYALIQGTTVHSLMLRVRDTPTFTPFRDLNKRKGTPLFCIKGFCRNEGGSRMKFLICFISKKN